MQKVKQIGMEIWTLSICSKSKCRHTAYSERVNHVEIELNWRPMLRNTKQIIRTKVLNEVK
ncbi:MAG: hypothetical protein ACTS4W_00350 [Candidatus Hodgkinia cicadicola]